MRCKLGTKVLVDYCNYYMDIFALTERLCHAEIRKLLLIIGMAIAVIIVFQCFGLPYEEKSHPPRATEGSRVMLLRNATILDNLESTNLYEFHMVTNDSHSEEEVDYRDEADAANSAFNVYKGLDSSLFKYKDHRSTDRSSTQANATERKENSENIVNDPKTTSGSDVMLPVILPKAPIKGIGNLDAISSVSGSFTGANISSAGSVKEITEIQHTNPDPLQNPSFKSRKMEPMSISQMNKLLLQSAISSCHVRPRRLSARDHELLSARQEIDNARIKRNTPIFYSSVYKNISKFQRSYEHMEHILKVYIYKEGEKPIFHQPKMRGIYASEGWFMKLMEGNRKFVVRDPRKAHLFYLPFSSRMLRTALSGQRYQDLQKYLKKYVELIAGKYSFWNRTGGADHFLVACHDWAPKLTKDMRNCIRALCNANVAKDFEIGKDTTLPVTFIRTAEAPLQDVGGKPPSDRSILAFFAGGMHGYLRPILLQYWENKEPDMRIFGPMPRDIEGKRSYREHMKSSKYCICARGYEVHTPRVIEAIYYECVPVIISDNYVPPFFEVLNWKAFSVFVQEKDIPNLRKILLSIPEEKYLEMQSRVKFVQQHFLWYKKPVKYDLFHMILHSVWHNRLSQIKPR